MVYLRTEYGMICAFASLSPSITFKTPFKRILRRIVLVHSITSPRFAHYRGFHQTLDIRMDSLWLCRHTSQLRHPDRERNNRSHHQDLRTTGGAYNIAQNRYSRSCRHHETMELGPVRVWSGGVRGNAHSIRRAVRGRVYIIILEQIPDKWMLPFFPA